MGSFEDAIDAVIGTSRSRLQPQVRCQVLAYQLFAGAVSCQYANNERAKHWKGEHGYRALVDSVKSRQCNNLTPAIAHPAKFTIACDSFTMAHVSVVRRNVTTSP